MNEFLYYKIVRLRDRNEALHDLLVTAKKGMKKTRVMYGANLSWNLMKKLLLFAEAEGLIKEVEAPKGQRYYRKDKPTMIWKTTERGLEYARDVYDGSKQLEEIDD